MTDLNQLTRRIPINNIIDDSGSISFIEFSKKFIANFDFIRVINDENINNKFNYHFISPNFIFLIPLQNSLVFTLFVNQQTRTFELNQDELLLINPGIEIFFDSTSINNNLIIVESSFYKELLL